MSASVTPSDHDETAVDSSWDGATHRTAKELSSRSSEALEQDARLREILESLLPRFGSNWGLHAFLGLNRLALSRAIYYHELYKKIVDVPGVICEFGVQWGATLSLLHSFRGMYEPYNVSRKIFGFDTFEGFATVDKKDGGQSEVGDYETIAGYEELLEEVLKIHESLSPVSHVRKFQLIKGDASITFDKWLEDNPHAIISMAIFDMDVYRPTKDVLERIVPRLTKGSVLVFDEVNCDFYPGETVAIQEVLGLNNLALRRFPHQSYCAWAVYGE